MDRCVVLYGDSFRIKMMKFPMYLWVNARSYQRNQTWELKIFLLLVMVNTLPNTKTRIELFFVYNRFMSHGENMWYERNGDYSIEITQDSHTKSKIHMERKLFFSRDSIWNIFTYFLPISLCCPYGGGWECFFICI